VAILGEKPNPQRFQRASRVGLDDSTINLRQKILFTQEGNSGVSDSDQKSQTRAFCLPAPPVLKCWFLSLIQMLKKKKLSTFHEGVSVRLQKKNQEGFHYSIGLN